MKTEHITIRVAGTEDAEALLKIYARYVEQTAITFEYEVPTVEEFRCRIEWTLERYPYLIAESAAGDILGYAYMGPLKERAAYDWSVETSIYLKASHTGAGIGRMLYTALEEVAKAQHILNLNACIADPEVEDEYLTKNSIQYHEHLGYRMIGRFHNCGYKFGRWYHMVWMEKMIGEHTAEVLPVIPFPQLDAKKLAKIGIKKV
ncbi:MAG: GNAT family N-acetyltransferase [Eubacteriales bacterium]|nr:GNAT family N-acetyltransferase [Eubacteriales bacterium]